MTPDRFALPVVLCRFAGQTCGACCHGDQVSRHELTIQLRRQSRLAAWQHHSTPPSPIQLLRHELAARRGRERKGIVGSCVASLAAPCQKESRRQDGHPRDGGPAGGNRVAACCACEPMVIGCGVSLLDGFGSSR
jgi:hypothetical protein